MALEVIAIVSFGFSTLGVLAKIYHHFDERFDTIDKHGQRVDTDLKLLSAKVDAMEDKFSYRIGALEAQVQPRYAKPRQGGTNQ